MAEESEVNFHDRLRQALGAENFERMLREHRVALDRRRRWEYLAKCGFAGLVGLAVLAAVIALS
jgi:hypothetical protein